MVSIQREILDSVWRDTKTGGFYVDNQHALLMPEENEATNSAFFLKTKKRRDRRFH